MAGAGAGVGGNVRQTHYKQALHMSTFCSEAWQTESKNNEKKQKQLEQNREVRIGPKEQSNLMTV